MARKAAIVFLVVLGMGSLRAQEERSYLDIVKTEHQLAGLFSELYNSEHIGDKTPVYDSIKRMFYEALKDPASFDFPWQELDMIGKMKSNDQSLNVYSWYHMVNREKYHYVTLLQVKDRRDRIHVYMLEDTESDLNDSQELEQDLENWHGKLYYQLITRRHRRKSYYTLLGIDFNNSQSTLKAVEMITIRRNGTPVFEKNGFMLADGTTNRVVFQYSAKLAMSLRYNKRLNQIVFDHLVPLHPIYTGNYRFYGPDGSYDGLAFEDGVWVFQPDVDARND